MKRRLFLLAAMMSAAGVALAKVREIFGGMPWSKDPPELPAVVSGEDWHYFTPAEVAAVNAIADRFIPPDEISIGGAQAGCARFIDRQLAGPFGQAATVYRLGPVQAGTPQQGPQSVDTPAQRYRTGLAALDGHCRATMKGKTFAQLAPAQQDLLLAQVEAGTLALVPAEPKAFFNLLLQNVREGYFADPIYGGNKDMAGWKMLGFPGARYDFRDDIARRGEDLNIIPISLIDRAPPRNS